MPDYATFREVWTIFAKHKNDINVFDSKITGFAQKSHFLVPADVSKLVYVEIFEV